MNNDEKYLEIYRQLRLNQDKSIYFLLTATGSAIVYALNRAQDDPLTLILIPWGIALILWGVSFFFGCRHLQYVSSTLIANATYLEIRMGEHPDAGQNPSLIEIGSQVAEEVTIYNSIKANKFANLQFWFFMIGIFSYVLWQLIVMYVQN